MSTTRRRGLSLASYLDTRPPRPVFDIDGSYRMEPDTTGMLAPARHSTCGAIFDEADVTRIARYADCDVFLCPGCGQQTDNRRGLFGSTESLR